MSFSSMRFDLKEVSDFDDFCGNHKLDFASVDKKMAAMMVALLSNAAPYDALSDLFNNDLDEMAQCAAYAFSLNKISREQIGTILEYREMKSGFVTVNNFSLLDENNHFDAKARGLLSTFFMMGGNEETFLKLLREIPKSECGYFVLKVPGKEIADPDIQGVIQIASQLNLVKVNMGRELKWHTVDGAVVYREEDSQHLIVLSVGARNALTKAIYGKHAKYLLHRLGIFTKEDIEKSVMNNARYCAASYPGIEDATQFHGITARSFYLSLHDEIHRRLISSIPNSVYESLLYAIYVVRERTGRKWSKEIWDSLDMDVHSFYSLPCAYRDDASTESITKNFLEILSANVHTENRPMALFTASAMVDTTWVLMIDMVLHPQEWKKLSIDSKSEWFEIYSYRKLYNFVLEHKSKIENEKSSARQVAILKFQYYNLPPQMTDDIKFAVERTTHHLQVLTDGQPIYASKTVAVMLIRYVDKFHPLISTDKVRLSDLSSLSPEMLTELLSDVVYMLVKSGNLSFSGFKALPMQSIRGLNASSYLFQMQKITIEQFKELSPEKLNLLNIILVRGLIISNTMTVDEFIALSPARVQYLECPCITALIAVKMLTMHELNTIPISIIERLKMPIYLDAIMSERLTVYDLVMGGGISEINVVSQGLFATKTTKKDDSKSKEVTIATERRTI